MTDDSAELWWGADGLVFEDELSVEELAAEQLHQDNLVLDEIAYYETEPEIEPWMLTPPPPIDPNRRPEVGSTRDLYDGPFLDEDGYELDF